MLATLIWASIGAVVLPILVSPLLQQLGFGNLGVRAGTKAAEIQAKFYGGLTRGVFSTLQSVGARGLSSSAALLVATVGFVLCWKIANRLDTES
jgi:hypothetical protein